VSHGVGYNGVEYNVGTRLGVRVGVVGCGIGKQHVAAFQSLPLGLPRGLPRASVIVVGGPKLL
jgi:hypothetical protein